MVRQKTRESNNMAFSAKSAGPRFKSGPRLHVSTPLCFALDSPPARLAESPIQTHLGEDLMMRRTIESSRQLLRHTVATLAYRGGKALRDTPPGFVEYRAGNSTRMPGEILAHVGDLLDWGLSLAKGAQKWHNSEPLPWDKGTLRFFRALRSFDAFLASKAKLKCSPEKLFQGPIADALTHIGQISMLRRLAGAPVRGENYLRAEIVAGRVGAKQAAPKQEFD
jgi:hypothetical protein